MLVFIQCAISLGWYVRKLGIDTDHEYGEDEKRHTVVDLWSDRFKKWYVIDPMFNTHFEKEKLPLNAFEIRKEYLNNSYIDKIFGNYDDEKTLNNIKDHHDVPSNYFWFCIYLRNNFFKDSNIFNSKVLLWIDKFNEKKTWYVGGKNKGEFKKHPMYEGAFIETNNLGLMYPNIT